MPVDTPLGAPGLYTAAGPRSLAIAGARMDVCAFLGVAPRGPARTGVRRSVAAPVESFDEYRRLYGGFEGPGRLPYAVASFFEQGGRRAYIVRIVPGDGGADGRLAVAHALLGPAKLWARSEGAWGNRLRAELTFERRPVQLTRFGGGLDASLELALPVGTLLRLALADGSVVLRLVVGAQTDGHPTEPVQRRVLALDVPIATPVAAADVVLATLAVDDGDGRTERHGSLGLSALHPRWLGRVLLEESDLLEPDGAWLNAELRPVDPRLAPIAAAAFTAGEDRFHAITPGHFFDDRWVLGDEEPRDGVHALADAPDVAVVVAPDLYDPEPLPDHETIVSPASFAGPDFAVCVDPGPVPEQADPVRGLDGLALDPTDGVDRRAIIGWQKRLHDLADVLRDWVVLLDVPPRLGQREILRWRSEFESPFSACFHPWLRVARPEDARGDGAVVNPSAVAAGIVALREHLGGVQAGPANVLAVRVVDVADRVDSARADELHLAHVNVFRPEADGVRLLAARTLARTAPYRQLSVRRLVSMIERALPRSLQWTVFEPNGPALRADLTLAIEGFLRQLFTAGAFAGASESEAFFVRCDDAINPAPSVDAGRLVAEVGVAPAAPVEYIVLRFTRDGDGTLIVEGPR